MEKKYKITIQQWNENKIFKQGDKCNAITFINKSNTNVPVINGYPLAIGESLSIQGNENEIDTSIYKVSIDFTAGTPDLYIITKVFE